MIARIAPAFSRRRKLAGIIIRLAVPGSGTALLLRLLLAVRLAAAGAARLCAILGSGLARSVEHVASRYRGYCDRLLLANLDDRNLRDMGIDRRTVGSDSSMSFWRLSEPLGMGGAPERRRGGRYAGDDFTC